MDPAANQAVIDAINHESAGPAKLAFRELRGRLRQDNPHKQFLAIRLVEQVLQHCSAIMQPFTYDLLDEVGKIAGRKVRSLATGMAHRRQKAEARRPRHCRCSRTCRPQPAGPSGPPSTCSRHTLGAAPSSRGSVVSISPAACPDATSRPMATALPPAARANFEDVLGFNGPYPAYVAAPYGASPSRQVASVMNPDGRSTLPSTVIPTLFFSRSGCIRPHISVACRASPMLQERLPAPLVPPARG